MRDKNIWLFNAGNAFAGNPKWLFLYVQEHHPEIQCVWLCFGRKLEQKMRALGYTAYRYKSPEARRIGAKAGVYVVEQNKEKYHDYLAGITVLNLWHGVTCKKLEHAVTEGYMEEGLVAKHIRNESVYRQQLMLVTSPQQERVFCEQCKVAPENVIRAPYPNSFEKAPAATFDHDFRAAKGVGRDVKVALYAPTFRDFDRSAFFARAIPDMDALLDAAERGGWMLVLKVHPQMEKDFQFAALKQRYADDPRVLFWDNGNDFYEVMDQVDMAIVDYSSIFFDLLAHGVKRFVRYVFDYGNKDKLRDFAFDYLDVTCGEVCMTFDELLAQFALDGQTDQAELDRVFAWAWAYSRDHSVEEIVQRALAHTPDPAFALPTLHSFDVFDTVIGRTCGAPEGVFAYVEGKVRAAGSAFPSVLACDYVTARKQAEANCRELVAKTLELRGDRRTEIAFDQVFERLQDLYGLDESQVEDLKRWELEGEKLVSTPIATTIDAIKRLLAAGEDVVLISDMYLPEAFVRELLAQADPVLAGLPLFLSNVTGRQKTKKGLFLDAFHGVDYRYGTWEHVGDSQVADVDRPSELGIHAQLFQQAVPVDPYAKKATRALGSFDGYQVGALLSRMLTGCKTPEERFACGYASLYFVPYVSWCIDDALRRGIACLYFISRDGYLLKLVADAIIAARGLPLKTRYLYGSRKVWRVPSQVGEIDPEFFSSYGNFTGVTDFDSLVAASAVGESAFLALFPELAFLKEQGAMSKQERDLVVERLRDCEPYRQALLAAAERERGIAVDYLKQEIDFDEPFAFVEFWGRGYTQACHTRLLMEADARVQASTYYYARSICPSDAQNVRVNFTSNTKKMLFIERIFANMPYRTVAAYRRVDGRVEPVLEPNECVYPVFQALEDGLPRFAGQYAQLALVDADRTNRALFDFGIDYFYGNKTDEVFLRCIAPLRDSITIQGEPTEFAPPLTAKRALDRLRGRQVDTNSMRMTISRTNPLLAKALGFLDR